MLNALVVGSGGLIGTEVVDVLSAHYSKLILLVRKKNDKLNDPKIIQILVPDFNKVPNILLNERVDHLYSCLGTTMKKAGNKQDFRKVDFEYVLSTAKLALKSGARAMAVVSSAGAAKNSAIFYLRVKGEMEEALMQLGFKSLLIFRPTLLLGKREESRFGEELGGKLMKWFRPLMIGTLKKHLPVKSVQVASCMFREMLKEQEGIYIIDASRIREEAV